VLILAEFVYHGRKCYSVAKSLSRRAGKWPRWSPTMGQACAKHRAQG
jgi:hypothetical protein